MTSIQHYKLIFDWWKINSHGSYIQVKLFIGGHYSLCVWVLIVINMWIWACWHWFPSCMGLWEGIKISANILTFRAHQYVLFYPKLPDYNGMHIILCASSSPCLQLHAKTLSWICSHSKIAHLTPPRIHSIQQTFNPRHHPHSNHRQPLLCNALSISEKTPL